MANRQHNEGYSLVQSPEISSSSDVLHSNRPFPYSSSCLPRGRPTYRRTVFIRVPLEHPFPRQSLPDLPSETVDHSQKYNTHFAIVSVALIFLCSIFTLSFVYANFPEVTLEEKQHIRIPWNIDQAKHLGIILNRYKNDHYLQVMLAVLVTYIFLQTFAIPGSLFLSILSGFLFPFTMALLLVCTCSAVGASLCFLLSQLVGRQLVLKYFPERANKWAVIVNKQRDNLFNYVVFLRVTPFLPNWFINLAAPVIGVPLKPFALGTFFGVAPPSFVAIQAGQTLHTMSNSDSTFSWTSVILLGLFAIISLVPVFLKKKLREKFD